MKKRRFARQPTHMSRGHKKQKHKKGRKGKAVQKGKGSGSGGNGNGNGNGKKNPGREVRAKFSVKRPPYKMLPIPASFYPMN